jgi:gluconolactonase
MYVAPDGKIFKAAENITRPNGLILSADDKVLYVNDARGEYILAYDVQPDGSLRNRRNFAKYDRTDPLAEGPFKLTSRADGLIVDNDGRLYVAGLSGVSVYSPQGRHIGTIPVSRGPQNLAFGGTDRKTLYIVGRGAAYKVQMIAQGLTSRAR